MTRASLYSPMSAKTAYILAQMPELGKQDTQYIQTTSGNIHPSYVQEIPKLRDKTVHTWSGVLL